MGIQAAEISAILKEQIKNFGKDAEVAEIGRVLSAPSEGRAEIMMDGLFSGRMTIDVRALEGVEPSSVTA